MALVCLAFRRVSWVFCVGEPVMKHWDTNASYRKQLWHSSLPQWCCLDLDLDSTRVQVGALGHTLTPFWSVLSCHLCFLPGDSHPWQVLVVGAPPVRPRTTWTPLEPRNLQVQRLSLPDGVKSRFGLSVSPFWQRLYKIDRQTDEMNRQDCYNNRSTLLHLAL